MSSMASFSSLMAAAMVPTPTGPPPKQDGLKKTRKVLDLMSYYPAPKAIKIPNKLLRYGIDWDLNMADKIDKALQGDPPRQDYEIIDRLRAKHPQLEIESCSSGGGRVDLGILTRTEQVWTSDNTEAFDRLRIQEGFSLAYAPKVMMDWVTDVIQHRDSPNPRTYLGKGKMEELKAAIGQIERDELAPAFKMLARVSRIIASMVKEFTAPANFSVWLFRPGMTGTAASLIAKSA